MKGGVYVRKRKDRRYDEGVRVYVGKTSRSFASGERKEEHLRSGRIRDEDAVLEVGVPQDRIDRVESWAIAKYGSYENKRDRPGGPLSPRHEPYTLKDRIMGAVKDRKERRKIRSFVKSKKDE